MFDIPTTNIGIADLENASIGNGVETIELDGVSVPVKRRRGRPKGSTKAATAPASPSPMSTVNADVQRASAASATAGELVFDIETVPDYSRLELFGLEPIPEPAKVTPREQCPPCAELLADSIPALKMCLAKLNPADEYLDLLADVERDGRAGKNRAGVIDAIAAAKAAKGAYADSIEKRRKLLSVTPEYCRVAALGWAVGRDEPQVLLAVKAEEERALLEKFWELVRECRPLVGFNCAAFDLPVLYCRSILLGVPSSRVIDTTPWKSDVLDLMATRFGRGTAMKLKDVARLYGVAVPAGDVDGSMVETLLATEPEKVAEYCKSDVTITRELRRLWSGYFCS